MHSSCPTSRPHSRRAFLAVAATAAAGGLLGVRPARTVAAGTFDVTAYGAKGDGRTDDGPAIAAAIAAAAGAGGGTVYFPAGVYSVSRRIELRSGVSLAGAGTEVAQISAASGVATAVVVGLAAQAVADLAIRDLTIDAGSVAGISGLQLSSAAGVTVERVLVRNAHQGIWINDAHDVLVSASTVRSSAGYGIQCYGPGNAIDACTVEDAVDTGIVLTGAPGARVTGCRVQRVGTGGSLRHAIAVVAAHLADGRVVPSTGATISGNYLRPAGGMGIHGSESPSLTVTANDINCAAATLECIGLAPGCSGSTIADNQAMDGQDNGISCSGASSFVTGNVVSRAQFMGIQVNGSNCRVTNNKVSNSGRRLGTEPWSGIDLHGATGCRVDGNRCCDDQPTKTQKYGVVSRNAAWGAADYNTVTDNDLRGNAIRGLWLVGTHNTTSDNRGAR